MTDFDQIVEDDPDRFFTRMNVENVLTKEDFDAQFNVAKDSIANPHQRKGFIKFKDALYRSRYLREKIKHNLNYPKELKLKSGKKVKGYKRRFKDEEYFLLLEPTKKDTNVFRVRDSKGQFAKKDLFFD